MKVRILEAGESNLQRSVENHIQGLRSRRMSVLLITPTRPAARLRNALGAGHDLFFLDATARGPPGVRFEPDAMYTDPQDGMDGLMQAIDRILPRIHASAVVVEDLYAFAKGMEPDFAAAFAKRVQDHAGDVVDTLDLVAPQCMPETRCCQRLLAMGGKVQPLEGAWLD